MKNLAITVFVLLIVLTLGLYLVSFQVREIESGLVTTFGKPTRQITEPGWYFKWPAPIQRVYKFDSRMRVFQTDLGETTTKGAIPLIVKTYVVWRVDQPLDFFNAVQTVFEAENKLKGQLSDTQNKVVGQYYFSDFVNSDESKIKINQIEDEMLTTLRSALSEDYGIEVKDLGIKQLMVSEDVSKDVFARMRAERNRRTEATIAQGKAQSIKIESEADAIKNELLAAAQARAKTIRGRGDAEAAKYYEMLQEDTKLAMFLRDVDALGKILQKRSTIVLSADTQPFELLREMPDLSSIDPNNSTGEAK
jgi:membrane protease subunit HflC